MALRTRLLCVHVHSGGHGAALQELLGLGAMVCLPIRPSFSALTSWKIVNNEA